MKASGTQFFTGLLAIIGCSFSSPLAARQFDSAVDPNAKERLIFVINTMENHAGGGISVAYLDEYRWMKRWETIYPDVKIVRIRSTTNADVKRQLEKWMLPNPNAKEIVALDVHSRGGGMTLLNENADFVVKLPNEIGATFSPIIGHFARGARIIFGDCEVLSGQTREGAAHSLADIADAFQIRDGYVYANQTVGTEGFAFAFQDRYNSNQGFIIETREGEPYRFAESRSQMAYAPALRGAVERATVSNY